MTAPRMILPGATYLVSRRCVQRELWLIPDAATTRAFFYILAVCARRYGILVHVVQLMPNHWHAVLTDPRGRISDFMRDLDARFARYLNTRFGRREALWSSDGASFVRLVGADAILERVVYTIVNPVAAGLVASHKVWPGLGLATLGGQKATYRRPERGFGMASKWPATASITMTIPPGFDHLTWEQWVARVEASVRPREATLQRRAKRDRRLFRGVSGVLGTRRGSKPARRHEPAPRGSRRPTLACADPDVRRAEIEREAQFRRDYRAALDFWKAGAKEVQFPVGTFKMIRLPGTVKARPPDESETAP